MTYLLTGGAGYIGSHTTVELLNRGHEVVIADNFDNSKPEVINRVEKITGKRPKVYEVDVCDKNALRVVFEENKIDAVVHFAGLKAVGESVRIPLRYYRNNLESTFSLVETMKEFGVNKLVFSSSATVYGIPETVPLVETMKKTGCTNPYGWTKYMIEQILMDACVADPDLTCVLLRYFNPIGAHESGLIGEDPKGIPNNLMPYVAQVASGKLKKINVFGNDYPTPDGTGVRDYIHVVDLAKGHVSALKGCKDAGVHIYNLGTGIGYSVLDMIKAFEKACGKTLPYEIVERRAGDVAECYATSEKAERELGWKAQFGIEEMCASQWKWQSGNPNGYNKD